MSNLKRSLTDNEIEDFTSNGGYTKAQCLYYIALCGTGKDSATCGYILKQCGLTSGGGGTCGTCTCK